MVDLQVEILNRDDDTLYSHKEIHVNGKTVETPAKAIPLKKLTDKDQVASRARGINELYFEVDKEGLRNSHENFHTSLKRNIRTALNKANNDEVNVLFINYKSTKELPEDLLEYLLDLVYSTSDFVTIPLMPELLSKIKDDGVGLSSTHFDVYFSIVDYFVETARKMNNKPVMGTIPPLPRVFTDRIIEYYIQNNVRAYAFNFNGRTVTAERQLTDMVTPLIRNLAVEDEIDRSVLYSINAHRGRSVQNLENTPARDFMTFGFGMDILGEKHTGGDLPPELAEKIASSEPEIRLFNRSNYVYETHGYDGNLADLLPSDTGLDPDRVAENPDYNYRYSSLINSEQMSLEAHELRQQIDDMSIIAHIEGKNGIQPRYIDDMRRAKSNYEGGQSQSSLDELDGLVG